MSDLIKLYIRSALLGFVLAAVFVGMLLWFNIMNLWSLIGGAIATGDSTGYVALIGLWVANAIVFGGVQFGIAIMIMAEDDDDEPRGGMRITPDRGRALTPELRPIPVRAEAKQKGPRRR